MREICPSANRGRREGRVSATPAAPVHKKSTGREPQVWSEQSGLPCAMALRLITRSPREPGFLAPVAARSQASHDLVSASGDQDHTALPYATMLLVWQRHRVHRISS